MRKTRRLKKKGGAKYELTPEQKAKRYAKVPILRANLKKIENTPDYPVAPSNDGIYTEFKKTIIPRGARFYFRSKGPIASLQDKPIWLNYSGAVNKQSFLLPPLNPENLPPEVPAAMVKRFGEWLNEVEVFEPLEILHFPVDYSSKDASEAGHSYSAFFEKVVRAFCKKERFDALGVKEEDRYDFPIACADGYSLDFFFKEMVGKFQGYSWIPGYRELSIYHPQEHLRLVRSFHSPI